MEKNIQSEDTGIDTTPAFRSERGYVGVVKGKGKRGFV